MYIIDNYSREYKTSRILDLDIILLLWAELATAWTFVAAVGVYNNNTPSVYYDLYTFHYGTVYVLILYP